MLRPHLLALSDVPHGGLAQLARDGVDIDNVIDFSSTILPGPAPEAVKRAIAQAPITFYPDPHCWELKQALGRYHSLPPEAILPGNGAVELIRAIAFASLDANDKALIVGPTFGEYAQAVRLVGAEAVEVRAESLDEVLAAMREIRPKLTFICNPNNPTGQSWSEAELAAMAAEGFLVVDEAYASFLNPEPEPQALPGRLTLRSMTKDFALAGVRLGYAVGEPALLSQLSKVLTPWGVSAIAQAAGIAALGAREEIRGRLDRLWGDREMLIEALRLQGWKVDARQGPYFLVHVGNASAFRARLLQQGLLVRDCTSFGLSAWIRISPRGQEANERLLAAFALSVSFL